ncbi:MAG: type II secretion system protein [Nitrospira sp.]|nr:type II secretion system protein [bacterium]MBL7049773.1 type II secretion system protein [Nitrospira sp.]
MNMPVLRRSIFLNEQDGFTLMEVIVAMVILAVSFTLVMQQFSAGLRSSRVSCDYSRAVVHAKDRMEELSLKPVSDSGEFEDGYRWESLVEPFGESAESEYTLMKISVRILWGGSGDSADSLKLVSLKAVENEQSL